MHQHVDGDDHRRLEGSKADGNDEPLIRDRRVGVPAWRLLVVPSPEAPPPTRARPAVDTDDRVDVHELHPELSGLQDATGEEHAIDEDQMLHVGDSFDVTATDLRAAVRRYLHEHGGELVREHGEANASENSAADEVIYARAARTMGVGEVSSTSSGHTEEAMGSVFLAGD